MQLLSSISIDTLSANATIQLLQGDITALPEEHSTDILVVSAFPNDYTPLPGSLMYALREKGLDVGELAKDKAVNLVPQLGCWMSHPLSAAQQQQFHFKQILCFEPSRESGSPETVVGNIFRCINTFAFEDHNNVIAMPVLASGKQKVPMEKMLPAMLDASMFWLKSGIPLDTIKLIVHTEEQAKVALPIFEGMKGATVAPVKGVMAPPAPSSAPSPPAQAPATPAAVAYDIFISYSHAQSEAVAALVKTFLQKNPELKIFYDRDSIPTGSLWIKQISDSIQHSKAVLCILTPQYRNSDACWDEFQCAKAKEYRTKTSVIKTINFMADADMPLIMAIYSYIDCTEADMAKLLATADALAQ